MESAAVQSKQKLWAGGRSPYKLAYGKLMMWFFLLSDSFTFGAFLISYGTIRLSSNYWVDHNRVFSSFPGFEANLPLAFVSLMTFILIFSSVTMVLAVHEGKRMNRKGVEKWLFFTILGGLAFLGCQALEWTHLLTHAHPVLMDDGSIQYWATTTAHNPFGPMVIHDGQLFSTPGPVAFGGYFYGITGFHGFHVSVGVVLNIVMLIKTMKGQFDVRGHYDLIEKAGLYWHFVDLVWVFVFLCFYLI